MEKQTEAEHRFAVEPCPDSLGGGWRVRLLEQEPGGPKMQMGGGVFPPESDKGMTADDAYAEALSTGRDWLDGFSR